MALAIEKKLEVTGKKRNSSSRAGRRPLETCSYIYLPLFIYLFALLRARPPNHDPPRGLRDRTPAPPPPSYAVAPSVSSEAATARGEQAGHRNPRAATGAHRGPPRGSGALPGGARPGVVPVPPPPPVAEVGGPKLRRRWHCGIGQRRIISLASVLVIFAF